MAYLLVQRKEVRRVDGGCGARASPGRVGMGSRLSRYLVKRRERSKFPRSVHFSDKGLFRKQHLLPESPGCSLGAGLVSISAYFKLIGKEAVCCQELVHKPNLNTIGLRIATSLLVVIRIQVIYGPIKRLVTPHDMTAYLGGER